jgi:hypothetical protein
MTEFSSFTQWYRIKQLIRSQAQNKGEDEDNNEDKKVIRRKTIY